MVPKPMWHETLNALECRIGIMCMGRVSKSVVPGAC